MHQFKKHLIEGKDVVEPVENLGTLAEGIAIAAPARGAEILKAVRATGGDIISVTDESVLEARKEFSTKRNIC